jgi:uncharacterized membrane protein
MTGEVSSFDYVLALDLGMTLAQVRALPNAEIVEWSAFYKWRDAMQKFAQESCKQ